MSLSRPKPFKCGCCKEVIKDKHGNADFCKECGKSRRKEYQNKVQKLRKETYKAFKKRAERIIKKKYKAKITKLKKELKEEKKLHGKLITKYIHLQQELSDKKFDIWQRRKQVKLYRDELKHRHNEINKYKKRILEFDKMNTRIIIEN